MAIKYIVNKPELGGKLARWVLLLSEFDYMVEFKPRKKYERVDYLFRLFMELGTEDISEEFLDERLFTV